MSARGTRIAAGIVAGFALFLAIKFALAFHATDVARSQMVAAAKADGLLPTGFAADCARVVKGTTWGTLDYEKASKEPPGRCGGASGRQLIVLHKVAGRWHVVGRTTAFPSRTGCRIDGVPPAIQAGIVLCYPPGERLPASSHGLP